MIALGIIAATTVALGAPAATSAAPDQARVARQPPAEARQGDRARGEREASAASAPLQVRILEDQEQAARRRAAEQAARDDEASDRQVRQRSDQVAIAQIVFGLLGTIGLAITLFYTARSAKASARSATAAEQALAKTGEAVDAAVRSADIADRALQTSQDHFIQSRRPYINAAPIIEFVDRGYAPQRGPIAIKLVFSIENIGGLPAMDVETATSFELLPIDAPDTWPEPDWSQTFGSIVPPTQQTFSSSGYMLVTDFDRVARNEAKCLWKIHIRYRNPTGEIHAETISLLRVTFQGPYEELRNRNLEGIVVTPLPGGIMT